MGKTRKDRPSRRDNRVNERPPKRVIVDTARCDGCGREYDAIALTPQKMPGGRIRMACGFCL